MKVKHDYKDLPIMPSWRDLWFILKAPLCAALGALLLLVILAEAYSIGAMI